ncbi:MAG: hypothetical protein Q8Q14_14355 [Gemmatimonadales bacterium]|nr:hypothetical protein [Gemmatimonadales bacterium]
MARVQVTLPFYVLANRKGARRLPEAQLASGIVLDGRTSRFALLGFRHRATAASWIEREGGHLQILSARSSDDLDRLAAVALVRVQCQWIALEPTLRGLQAECFLDLAEWLADRQPWSQTLYGFCRRHDIDRELPVAVAAAALPTPPA